jgi:hypothetical protein
VTPAATKEGDDPRRAVTPWPSSSLEMVMVWTCLSSSLAASKGRQIRGYGWGLQKIGFRSIYSVGGFTEAIGSKYLHPKALGHL